MCAALLPFVYLLKQELHTLRTMDRLDNLRDNFQRTCIDQLGHLRGFKLPKFFRLRIFPYMIAAVGSARFTNTGPQESTHKNILPSASHTNNRLNTSSTQRNNHATLVAGIKRLLDAYPANTQERNSMVCLWY